MDISTLRAPGPLVDLRNEAADEIERLRECNSAFAGRLGKFASALEQIDRIATYRKRGSIGEAQQVARLALKD